MINKLKNLPNRNWNLSKIPKNINEDRIIMTRFFELIFINSNFISNTKPTDWGLFLKYIFQINKRGCCRRNDLHRAGLDYQN